MTNGIENDKNSLIEFMYKYYFEKMFFLFNDDNKKNYFKKKHILLIYLEKLNENSSLFLIDFLYKDKTHIGIFKLRDLISLLEFYIHTPEEFDKNKKIY